MGMVTLTDFGTVESIHFAYSTDPGVRFRASSGGFVKSFLVYLVETGIVDSVIITRTGGPSSPLIPQTVVTSDKNEIVSSRTNSVYMVHNPLAVLPGLSEDKTYAFVGLPCHVRRLWELQGVGQHWNIPVIISLFCNYSPRPIFTQGILQRLNVREQDVKMIEYRGNGWPGGFTAYLKDRGMRFIPSDEYWSNDLSNGPKMCSVCSEIGAYADISVCDPWNLGLQDTQGTSLVICRSGWATSAVKDSASHGYIDISNCNPAQLLKSQGGHIEDKLKRGKTQRIEPRGVRLGWLRIRWRLEIALRRIIRRWYSVPLP